MDDPYNNGNPPVIIANADLLEQAYLYDTFKGFKSPRVSRMFGTFLPDPPHIHDGGVDRLRFEGPYIITHPPTDDLLFPTVDTVPTRNIDGEASMYK